ncbi:MAG: hypothetical protein NBV63_01630 [Candidatus Pacebacteria bacterium]|nr:hypothetical protein [Candidatus Paceibacterota bacterium]
MSSEAISAGSHLFTTLAASLGLDFEQLQELQNVDGFDALFDGQSGGSFMQVAYSTEQNIKELTKLRVDAVANAVGDQTVFDDAYEGSHPDIPVEQDKSKIMQAARAIADKGGFSPEKREAFLQYIQDNRGSMKSATIENGKVILMADGARGGYNANLFRTNLDETERDVVTGTFTYTEGGVKKTETVYIFNDCANPAVDAAPDQVVTQTPVPTPPKVCTETETIREFVGGKIVGEDGKPLTPEEQNLVIRPGEKIGVVQIDGSETPIVEDKNGDGNYFREDKSSNIGVCWDQGEILPGITPERIEADLDAYEQKFGYRPKFLIYDVTDCNGNNVVACWNVKEGKWGILYNETKDGIPVDKSGKPPFTPSGRLAGNPKEISLVTDRNKLLYYLNQTGYKK